jgi:hypothetical protein
MMPETSTAAGAAEFSGGARRCDRKPPFFLVPRELLEAVAWTRLEGDRKYEPGNWQTADREFFVDCLSHSIQHLMDAPWDDAEAFEMHLGHAACNIAFILWATRRGVVSREDFQQVARLYNRDTSIQP